MRIQASVRRTALLLLLLVAAVPAGAVGAVAPQTATPSPTYYESPTFGYLIPISGNWQVQAESSQGGMDHLALHGAAGTVTFDGHAGDGGDPAACLAAMGGRLAAAPTVSQLTVGTNAQGGTAELHDTGLAERIYTLQLTGASGMATKVAETVFCRTLVPGKAVLEITHVVPLDRYDQAAVAAGNLISAAILPRRSLQRLQPGQDLSFQLGYYARLTPGHPADFSPPTGSVNNVDTVTVTRVEDPATYQAPAPAPSGTHWASVGIEFHNAGADPLAADASAPYVVDQNGFVVRVAFYRWDGAPGDPSAATQQLPGGASATATILYALAGGSRIARVACDCFPTLGAGTRIVAQLLPPSGALGPYPAKYFDPCEPYPGQSVLVLDRAGDERAMLSIVSSDGQDISLYVENTGQQPFAVDPIALAIRGVFDARPTGFQWELGATAPDRRVQTLAPGQRAIVRVTFPSNLEPTGTLNLDAVYQAAPDQEIFLGNVVGCQGTPGRPRILGTG